MKIFFLFFISSIFCACATTNSMAEKRNPSSANNLPKGISEMCGKVVSLDRDVVSNQPTLNNKKVELTVGLAKGQSGFAGGFSVDRATVKDEIMKSIILSSLGKYACIKYSEDNRFWLESISLTAE